MKKLAIALLSLIISIGLTAQSDPLFVYAENGTLFLHHTVVAKENFYSIGRMYNISPKEIAPFNNIPLEGGLEIGQLLKIPLKSANFVQRGAAPPDEVFVPLYHVITEKEGLFRIGQTFNKVSVNDLKTWNKLSSESINIGDMLVVGFLRVKSSQSALAVQGIKRIGGAVARTPAVVAAADNKNARNQSENTSAASESSAIKTETKTSTTPQPQRETDGTGFFKDSYREQAAHFDSFRSERGDAAIFKSTSGWQDSKYYALMNNITPGTIVRITNTNNDRIVFAKVLGELPPGKENEGLLIRISNAAAAQLRVNDRDIKFSAEVAYARNRR